MSRDPWLKQVRIASFAADSRLVEDALTDGVPDDGLQHAGSAVVSVKVSAELVAIARRLIKALGDRDWLGDAELIDELEHYADDTAPDLAPLPVALDELADALNQSPASESFVDMTTGVLWPAQIVELGEFPGDFDPASDQWMIVQGVGSRAAYKVMQRFIETIERPDLAKRLENALEGSGAFRRFQTELRRHEEEFTRWHRFRDDARLGQARAWLADEGKRSVH